MKEMKLKNNPNFKASLRFEFGKRLNGIKANMKIFHSNETNSAKYVNYTFPDKYTWDEFYQRGNDRRIL